MSRLFLEMYNPARGEDIFKEEVAVRVLPDLVGPGAKG